MARGRRFLVAVSAGALLLGGAPLLTGAASGGTARAQDVDADVRLNEIQTIGSHNSYHLLPSQPEVDLRHSIIGDADEGFTYAHQPLPVQFQSQKVRQIELDVFLDAAGGRYATPLLRTVATPDRPYDPIMQQPGLKVLHVQDVDYASTCLTLKQCLTQIETWSDANPSHVPIAVLLELKDDDVPFPGFEFVHPEPFDVAAMDTLDAEIRDVMDPEDLITPDDVRGGAATLDEAVTTTGWPTLGESRGKVMFLMDNGGGYRTSYLTGHPNLEGRALFTNASPGDPDAAFIKVNDPLDPAIPGLVQAGYVVRTRADGDTVEARSNDTTLRDAALASGAQWVSTDYPTPGMAIGFTSPYYAEIPGGTVARCNPVLDVPGCVDAELDTIYTALPPPTTTTSTTTSTVPGTTPPVATGPAGAVPVAGDPRYTG